jgi:hypothetical protein
VATASDSAEALSQTTGGAPILAGISAAEQAGVVNFDLGERADGPCVESDALPDDDDTAPGPVPASPAFTG